MTDLAVLAEPGALDRYAEPGAYIVLSCERAKAWLVECIEHSDIDQLVDLKSQAEAIRVYTTAKQLGRDAELAAAEIVRRSERGIVAATRRQQADGKVARQHENIRFADVGHADIRSVPEATGMTRQAFAEIIPLADGVTDEMFDEAIAEAKEEGNLSRANVVRAVARKKITDDQRADRVEIIRTMAAEGNGRSQIASHLGVSSETIAKIANRNGITIHADAIVGKKRRLDSNRIVAATVESVIGIDQLFDAIDYSSLDRSQLDHWVSSLSDAIRSLTTLRNNLKKEQTQ